MLNGQTSQQIVKWIQNHKDKLSGGAHPRPAYLKLKSFVDNNPPSSSTRAKSARDLFISDNPNIRQQTKDACILEGITDKTAITRRVNDAYTEAIGRLSSAEREIYEKRSQEDKARCAAERGKEREAAADVSDAPTLSRPHKRRQCVCFYFLIREILKFLWQNAPGSGVHSTGPH